MNIHITTQPLKGEMIAVYVKVHISQKERYLVHTGVKIKAHHWNDATKCVKASHFQHVSLNRTRSQVYELLASGKVTDYSRKNIDRLLGNAKESFITFYKQQLQQEIYKLAPSSIITLKTTLHRLKEFRREILMSELSFELIREFDAFLRKQGLSDNTIPKHHRHIKKYISLAV